MFAILEIPPVLSLKEFLVWDAPSGHRLQLVDGEPRARARTGVTQGIIHGELGALISNLLHARHPDWTVIFNMGIQPRVRADDNLRVPPFAITCAGPHEEE